MHTAEEVRKEAEDFLPWKQAKEMLLAYADLLEKREAEPRELSRSREECERLREALASIMVPISKSTCCESCQEAKLGALSALAATRKDAT